MAYHPTDIHIGNRLRNARRASGLSQSELASRIGVTFQQVQKYENGANRIAGSRLWEVCKVLRLEPGYFFAGLDKGKPDAHDVLLERMDLEAARDFSAIQSRQVKKTLRALMATLANAETAKEGARD